MASRSPDVRLNALEREIGLDKAIALYEKSISQDSDENDAFERLATIYRGRNQIADEVRVSKKAVAFYEHAVFVEHLESRLPVLNKFTKRVRAAELILSSQREKE